MSFTLGDWASQFAVLCFTTSALLGIFISKKVDKKIGTPATYDPRLEMALIFGEIFVIGFIFICGIVSMYPRFSPQIGNQSSGTSIPIEVSESTTISLKGYDKRAIYGKLNEVNECVNKGYDNKFSKLNSNDYYYDAMKIDIQDRSMSLSELWSYMKKENHNLIYTSTSKLHKASVKLKLEGVLKTEIENGITKYSINDYLLGVDEKGLIASLANNQKVSLDIIYNKDLYRNDKKIVKYIIVNAVTK